MNRILKAFTFIVVICVLAFVAVLEINRYRVYFDMATKEELKELREEFREKTEYILANQDTLKQQVRGLKKDTDTLKAGQNVIYHAIKENEQRSIFELIFK